MDNSHSPLDDIFERQVVQFNHQVEELASFHKVLISTLCVQRVTESIVNADNVTDKPSHLVRNIPATLPNVLARTVLWQVGMLRRVSKVTLKTARILPSISRGREKTQPMPQTKAQPTIIEGEFLVINSTIDPADEVTTNNEKEEQ